MNTMNSSTLARFLRQFPFVRAGVAALLLGALVGTTGCVAVVAAGAAGAGVAWVRGALQTTLEAPLDRTFAAANAAVREMQLAKVSDRKSSVDAQVVARTALDKKIEITLKRTGDRSTLVDIRVGVFGDEAMSLAVLEKIKANL
jgi:hypothetical protein